VSWGRIDDKLPEHPKWVELEEKHGPRVWADALALWVVVVCYCNRHETDGVIRAAALKRICPMAERDASRAIGALVGVRLLDRVDAGFCIHDFLDFNKSAEERRAEREADKARKKCKRGPPPSGGNPGGVRPESEPDSGQESEPPSGGNPGGALARAPGGARVLPVPSRPVPRSDLPGDRGDDLVGRARLAAVDPPVDSGSEPEPGPPNALAGLATTRPPSTMASVRDALESAYAAAFAERWGKPWTINEPADGMPLLAVARWCLGEPEPEAAAREVIAGAFVTPRMTTGRKAPWSWIAEQPETYAATGREVLARARIEPAMTSEARANLVSELRSTGTKGATR
jgi:hypothetical protein